MEISSEYYYRILGLKPGASLAEVKTAYRNLAKIYHPDKDPSPDSVAMYREIRTAYEKLMNWDNSGGIHTRTGASTNVSTNVSTNASTGAKTSAGTGTSPRTGAKTSTAGSYGKTNPTITYHRETEAEDKETEIDWLKYTLSSLAIGAILAALMFFILKITSDEMSLFASITVLMVLFALF